MDFESRLNHMNVPGPENDGHETRLRTALKERYFGAEKKYQYRFRLSVGFASVLLVILFVFIWNPELAIRANQIAFQGDVTERFDPSSEIADEEFVDYTSLYNPEIYPMFHNEEYEEEKAYVIRKYNSPAKGELMIVSEFDPVETLPVGKNLPGSI